MDLMAVVITTLGIMSVIGGGYLFIVSDQLRLKREVRAIENAHWEQYTEPAGLGKTNVFIHRVARMKDWSQVVGKPEHIALVDENDDMSPTMHEANEAAALRMMTNNSFLRPKR